MAGLAAGLALAIENRFGWNGEPKGLAIFIVPSLVTSLSTPLTGDLSSSDFGLFRVGGCLPSATGMIGLAMGLFAGMIVGGKRLKWSSIAFVIFVIAGLGVSVSEMTDQLVQGVLVKISWRIYERRDSSV